MEFPSNIWKYIKAQLEDFSNVDEILLFTVFSGDNDVLKNVKFTKLLGENNDDCGNLKNTNTTDFFFMVSTIVSNKK